MKCVNFTFVFSVMLLVDTDHGVRAVTVNTSLVFLDCVLPLTCSHPFALNFLCRAVLHASSTQCTRLILPLSEEFMYLF